MRRLNLNRRNVLSGALGVTSACVLGRLPARAEGTPLRIGSVKFGSLNWLLDTIKAEGLDAKFGASFIAVELATNQAGPISLLSGGSDIVVSDWPWALRQRGLGEALKFSPFSATLGGVMVPAASPAKSLADLEGKRLGVAGSGIDKSWLLLQAYARKSLGLDLAAKATIQFGAAPLLSEQLRSGTLDGMLNFWTQNVRLPSGEFRQLISMKDTLAGLGVEPIPAFVGFIWKETLEQANPAGLAAALKAIAAGNGVLASSEAAWERLRPAIKAQNDAEFDAIKRAYRSGIVPGWRDTDMKSAQALMQLLIDAGDQELIGAKTKFDPKLFHDASS